MSVTTNAMSKPIIRLELVGDDVHAITHKDYDGYTDGFIYRLGVPKWKQDQVKRECRLRNEMIASGAIFCAVRESESGVLVLVQQ